MNRTIGLSLSAWAGLMLAAGAADAQSVSWDLSNEYQATSIAAEADAVLRDALMESTGGDFVITLHPGGALGYKSKDHLYAVGDGEIQMANTLVGQLTGIEPFFQLSSLPFLTANAEEAWTLYQAAKPEYERIFEDNNQILLYAVPWPASGLWGTKPIDSLEDLKGLKIRTYDAAGTVTMNEIGANAFTMTWGDMMNALGTPGGPEAVLTSAEGGVFGKFWDLGLNQFTQVDYAYPLNLAHVNRDAFEDLSPEHQEALMEAARKAEEFAWNAVLERRERNYKTIAEEGGAVTTDVSADYLAALQEAGQAAIAKWIEDAGESGRAVLDSYREQTGK